MACRDLQLAGSTSLERDDANVRVAEAISQCGAVLVDFSVFANLSTLMRVELPARQIGTLGKRLRASGLMLDEPSETALKSCGSTGDVVATLRIRFKRAEPVGKALAAADS
jgi:hypothetical protein